MTDQNVQHGDQPAEGAEVQHGKQPPAEATVQVEPNGGIVADFQGGAPVPPPGADDADDQPDAEPVENTDPDDDAA